MGLCSVIGCSNRSDRQKRKPGVGFHKFPKDSSLRKLWIKAVRRKDWEPSLRSCVCTAHFSDNDVNRSYPSGPRLRELVIPTVSLGYEDPNHTDRLKKDLVKVRERFARIAQLQRQPITIENTTVGPSQAADSLKTKDLLSETPSAVVQTATVNTARNKETSPSNQLSTKPMAIQSVVKIVCEICDASVVSSAKYECHRLEHGSRIITPSSAPGDSESKTSVSQKPISRSSDEINDSGIKDRCNGTTNNSDKEDPAGFEKVNESSQDIICFEPIEKLPDAVAVPVSAAGAATLSSYPRANFICEICKRDFFDHVSFGTHKRVHQLTDQIKTGNLKRLGEKAQIPKTPDKDPPAVHRKMIAGKELKKHDFDVKNHAKQLVKAETIIKVIYQKMKTLLLENMYLKAIMKKQNIDFNSWKESVEFLSGIEGTLGLKRLDDIILNDANGSFLEKLNLSQISKLGNVAVLVVDEDGTLTEKIIDGPLPGGQLPRKEEIRGNQRLECANIQVDQVCQTDECTAILDTNASVDIETPAFIDGPLQENEKGAEDTDEDSEITCSDYSNLEGGSTMDTDASFEIDTASPIDLPLQKNEKEPEVANGGSSRDVATDPLEGIVNYLTATTDSVNSTNAPKHACGLCGHRSATQDDMLEHITTHIAVEDDKEVDEEVPNLQEPVGLTGESTTRADEPETNRTTNVHSTIVTQATHASKILAEPQECSEECSEKWAPSKPKRKKLRPKKYFCDLCDYRSRFPNEIIAHKLSVHGVAIEAPEEAKNLLCGVCDYRTNNSANMKRHILTHTGIKQFACSECDYRTAVKWSLESHMQVHSDVPLPKSYKCEYCPYAGTTRFLLKAHMKRTHKLMTTRPSATRSIQCEHCDKTFAHRGTYRIHRMSHEIVTTSNLKLHTCDICFRQLKGRGALGKHRSVCVKEAERIIVDDSGGTTQEKYACRSCGEHFSTHQEGMAHQCPQPSRHQCTVCAFSCRNKQQLSKHIMIHTGEKPYECKVCHYRFRQLPHLTAHMRTHTGEKPFTCSHCGKAFASRQTMQVHEKIHTGEMPYECGFCDYQAKEKRTLKKHMQTRHNIEEADLVFNDMQKITSTL